MKHHTEKLECLQLCNCEFSVGSDTYPNTEL